MWLRSPKSEWGWLPAKIIRKEVVTIPSSVSKPRSTDDEVGADNGTELKDAYGRYRTSATANYVSCSGGGGRDPDPLSESLNDANDTNNISCNHSEGDAVQPVMEEHTSTTGDEQDQHQSDKQQEQQQIKVEVVKNENENDEDVDQLDGTSPEDTMIELTLVDDFDGLRLEGNNTVAAVTGIATADTAVTSLGQNRRRKNGKPGATTGDYYANAQPFTEIIRIANNAFQAVRGEEHQDIKLRNIPMAQYGTASSSSTSLLQLKNNNTSPASDFGLVGAVDGSSNNNEKLKIQSTTTAALTMMIQDTVTGGVDDLIGLTHLHEPAILHAIRLRYDADIIYTSTGPILLAINPFKVSGNYFRELKVFFFHVSDEMMSCVIIFQP